MDYWGLTTQQSLSTEQKICCKLFYNMARRSYIGAQELHSVVSDLFGENAKSLSEKEKEIFAREFAVANELLEEFAVVISIVRDLHSLTHAPEKKIQIIFKDNVGETSTKYQSSSYFWISQDNCVDHVIDLSLIEGNSERLNCRVMIDYIQKLLKKIQDKLTEFGEHNCFYQDKPWELLALEDRFEESLAEFNREGANKILELLVPQNDSSVLEHIVKRIELKSTVHELANDNKPSQDLCKSKQAGQHIRFSFVCVSILLVGACFIFKALLGVILGILLLMFLIGKSIYDHRDQAVLIKQYSPNKVFIVDDTSCITQSEQLHKLQAFVLNFHVESEHDKFCWVFIKQVMHFYSTTISSPEVGCGEEKLSITG